MLLILLELYALEKKEEDKKKIRERLDELDNSIFVKANSDVQLYERRWQAKLNEAKFKKIQKTFEVL